MKKEYGVKIEKTDFNIEEFMNKESFNEETKEKMKNADILILPEFNFRESGSNGFYEESADFRKYLRSELSDISIEFYENNGEYKSLGLHSGDIWMPILYLVGEWALGRGLDYIVNLSHEYIVNKYNISKEEEDSKIAHAIYYTKKNDETTIIKYDGPVSGLDSVFKK